MPTLSCRGRHLQGCAYAVSQRPFAGALGMDACFACFHVVIPSFENKGLFALQTSLVCIPKSLLFVQRSLLYKLHGFLLGFQYGFRLVVKPVHCRSVRAVIRLADSAASAAGNLVQAHLFPLRSCRFTPLRHSVMLQLMPQFITFNSMNGRK